MKNTFLKITTLALGLFCATLASGLAAGLVNVDAKGVAIKGYDPVAYFTDSKPVKGDEKFQSTYQGATYDFASSEHKALFDKDPAKYAPQFGGYCAYGAAKGARRADRSDRLPNRGRPVVAPVQRRGVEPVQQGSGRQPQAGRRELGRHRRQGRQVVRVLIPSLQPAVIR